MDNCWLITSFLTDEHKLISQLEKPVIND